jgi:RNA-directed DNA polymerase
MIGGLSQPSEKGTPQSGPLSPLLSRIVLDVPDRELAQRGHRFCRYADDCNVYVLGYSFTHHRQTKIRVPAKICQKMRAY